MIVVAPEEVAKCAKWIEYKIPLYTTSQLALALHAWGMLRLQDEDLFQAIAKEIMGTRLQEASAHNLVRIVAAYDACQIPHFELISSISMELQERVHDAVNSLEGSKRGTTPSLQNLAEVATSFASLSFRDFSYFEMLTKQVITYFVYKI